MLKLFCLWPVEVYSCGSCVLLRRPCWFWSISFLPELMKMFRAHLVLFLAQIWNQLHLKGALASFSGKWFLETTVWRLGDVHCCWVVLTFKLLPWICMYF